MYNKIIGWQGEGVMLRSSGSQYVPGRSHILYRYKKFTDTEVLVTEKLEHGLQCQQ